jgi:hypothetical protein
MHSPLPPSLTGTRRGRASATRARSAWALWAAAAATGACSQAAEAPRGEPEAEIVTLARAASPEASASASPASATPPAKTGEPALAPPSATAKRDERRPITGDGDRLYAKARHVWIQAAPRPSNGWLGYLTVGGSVRVKGGDLESAAVYGPGCERWIAIEPTGYVCLGDSVTVDPSDPEYLALLREAPDIESPWPYEYAESIGAPRYERVPTAEVQRATEWDLDAHRARLAQAQAAGSDEAISAISSWLVGVDASPAGAPMPELVAFGPTVREARAHVARGSTVAYTRAFDHDGRAWLLASDHAIVPKDRVRPFPRSAFHGVELRGDVKLPIAFFRKEARPEFRLTTEGTFEPTGEKFPVRSWVMITGQRREHAGEVYLETTRDGRWAKERDVTVATTRANAPFSPEELVALEAGQGRDRGYRYTWVDVSVLGGWMVAYEGLTPVFATLVSGGRGGVPVRGYEPIETASTPTGTFRVDGKFYTATMVSSTDSSIVHADVPFVMNFHGPHALHSAYWHDAWGELKSGGCVNLSPQDAKRIFAWSEPAIPVGWHGVRSVPELGPPTRVVVHE